LSSYLAPQRLIHALARVLHLERGHVCITFRCRHPGVAENLLHYTDVHALEVSESVWPAERIVVLDDYEIAQGPEDLPGLSDI